MDNYKKLFEPYVDFSMDATCLRDVVYKGLKKAIVEGRIQTGSRIVEKRFADQMNISRTPVREALKRLELEGFVEHVPNVGSVVKCIDEKEVVSLYQARAALEAIVLPDIHAQITEQDAQMLKGLLEEAVQCCKAQDMEGLNSAYLKFQIELITLGQNKMIFTMLRNLDKNYDRFRRQLDDCFEDYLTIVDASMALVTALKQENLETVLKVNDQRQMTICGCLLKRMTLNR